MDLFHVNTHDTHLSRHALSIGQGEYGKPELDEPASAASTDEDDGSAGCASVPLSLLQAKIAA
ncbi:MAG: hypothetical protein FWC26_03815 [Fibromonadales bacterium]|nr:hypothetical protein [Fibromonadales bacterium]